MSKLEDLRRELAAESFRDRPEGRRETKLGETGASTRGYYVQVLRVGFPAAGTRIRFRLMQGDQFVRHLDLSEEVARQLRELLVKVRL